MTELIRSDFRAAEATQFADESDWLWHRHWVVRPFHLIFHTDSTFASCCNQRHWRQNQRQADATWQIRLYQDPHSLGTAPILYWRRGRPALPQNCKRRLCFIDRSHCCAWIRAYLRVVWTALDIFCRKRHAAGPLGLGVLHARGRSTKPNLSLSHSHPPHCAAASKRQFSPVQELFSDKRNWNSSICIDRTFHSDRLSPHSTIPTPTSSRRSSQGCRRGCRCRCRGMRALGNIMRIFFLNTIRNGQDVAKNRSESWPYCE